MAVPSGYTNSGYSYSWRDDYMLYVKCDNCVYNGVTYVAEYPLPNGDGTGIEIQYDSSSYFKVRYNEDRYFNIPNDSTVYCSCSSNTNNVFYYNYDMAQDSVYKSVLDGYYCTYTADEYSVYTAIGAVQPQPTAKTVINGLTPTKKMFGTTEVVKEVYNGVTVYEKATPVSSYNVTITESNNSSINYKSYLKVYDGQDATGTLLINSTSKTALQATTVVCTTGYLYVELWSTLGGGYAVGSVDNIVGDITRVDWGITHDYAYYEKISVASDGSFTVSTDYNYD